MDNRTNNELQKQTTEKTMLRMIALGLVGILIYVKLAYITSVGCH
jgi:hypothetical protein